MAIISDVEFVVTLLKPDEFREREAKRIEDWLEEDGNLIYHDPTCDKVTKENRYEWHCQCFLNEIVQRIKDGQ